jgi:heme-degrading monooxygenase HmoA
MAPRYHLARAPVDSPALAGFVAELNPVNALADAAPGFVWRLQTEDGNATAVSVPSDDSLMVNLSVWESLDALGAFVHDSRHREVMRRRREWFLRMAEAYLALWWVPAGHLPTVGEAEQRLLHLRAHGPTAVAFTLRSPFPPPGGESPPAAPPVPADRWTCPTA